MINANKLCILNNKSNTYLNLFTGFYSISDLTLCDPQSYMAYGWKIHDDLWSSDHFPIILERLRPLHEYRFPHWKINEANLQVFEIFYKQKLLQDPNIIDQTKHFTKILISIANKTIATTSASIKHNTPWFNDDCRTVIRQRKTD